MRELKAPDPQLRGPVEIVIRAIARSQTRLDYPVHERMHGPAVLHSQTDLRGCNLQAPDRKHEFHAEKRRGTTFGVRLAGSGQAAGELTHGGRQATSARAQRQARGGAGGERRTKKRFPFCSTSVSVSESRSARISGQDAHGATSPSAAMRSSSSFFRTRARKLQETWPRMVSSSL